MTRRRILHAISLLFLFDGAPRIPVHHDVDRQGVALPGQQCRVGILAALGKPSEAEERRHVAVVVAVGVEGRLGIVVVARRPGAGVVEIRTHVVGVGATAGQESSVEDTAERPQFDFGVEEGCELETLLQFGPKTQGSLRMSAALVAVDLIGIS